MSKTCTLEKIEEITLKNLNFHGDYNLKAQNLTDFFSVNLILLFIHNITAFKRMLILFFLTNLLLMVIIVFFRFDFFLFYFKFILFQIKICLQVLIKS